MTAKALIFYAVGLWAFSGVKIIVSGFYALQDTVTPVRVSIFTLISYIFFGLLLKIPLEHCGLALALSLSSSLQFVILIFLLSGKIDGWNLFPVIKSMFKSLCAAITMGLAVIYLHSAWLAPTPESTNFYLSIKLIILMCTGIVVYFGTARIMGCEEISFVLNILNRRTKEE